MSWSSYALSWRFKFTDANFGYYDERFSHRIASGDLDYTKFAAGSDDNAIYLENSGVNITLSTPSRNPLVVIANYLFDSLPNDAFRFTERCGWKKRVSQPT